MFIVVYIDQNGQAQCVAMAATRELAQSSAGEWWCSGGRTHIVYLPDHKVQELLLAMQRQRWKESHT